MSETATSHPFSAADAVDCHDGAMPPEARAAYQAHLTTCEECRRTLAAAEAGLFALDAALADPPPVDVAEAERLFAVGAASARQAKRRRRLFLWPAAALAGAAALVAALLLADRRPPPPSAPRQELAQPPPPRRFPPLPPWRTHRELAAPVPSR
ncbi:MAG: zf-HC2 domain-containing protein [Myxococcales bacterium]